MNKKIKPIARTQNIVVQKTDTEILLYDLAEDKAFCLNETSAIIWRLLDGNKTTEEISNEISVQTKSIVSEELVWLAIDQFQKDGLIENAGENRFIGLSRREVIQKVAFASAIALPLVSSLIAPKAAVAQSCAAFLGACAVSGDCCSNNCRTNTNLPNNDRCCAAANTGPSSLSTGALACLTATPDCSGFQISCCSGVATDNGLGGACPAADRACVCT